MRTKKSGPVIYRNTIEIAQPKKSQIQINDYVVIRFVEPRRGPQLGSMHGRTRIIRVGKITNIDKSGKLTASITSEHPADSTSEFKHMIDVKKEKGEYRAFEIKPIKTFAKC